MRLLPFLCMSAFLAIAGVVAAQVTVSVEAVGDGDEGAGAPTSGMFRVALDNAQASMLRVDYSVDGTADMGSDYAALDGFVEIPAGDTQAFIEIVVLEDAMQEPDEDVVLSLEGCGVTYPCGPDTALVTISDDNDPLRVSVRRVADAMEGTAPGAFEIYRETQVAAQPAVTVQAAVFGDATPAVDYASLSTSYVLGANQDVLAVPVTSFDDSVDEWDQQVRLRIAPGPGYVPGTAEAALSIVDDDDPPVLVITGKAASEAMDVVWEARLTQRATEKAVSFTYQTDDGTATGADYEPTSGTVDFPVPAPVGATRSVFTTSTHDTVQERDELVFLLAQLIDPDSASPATIAPVAATILDDDLALVTVAPAPASVSEAGAGAFRFTRTNSDGKSLMAVGFQVSGTATLGTDYTLGAPQATFENGDLFVDVVVTSIDDPFEERDETIVLDLLPGSRYDLGTPQQATMALVNNDRPEVRIEATVPTAEEGLSSARFVITRQGLLDYPLTVAYTVSGDATPGADYETLSGTVALATGNTSVELVVVPIDDTLDEPPEVVRLTLAPRPGYRIAPTQPAAEVDLLDNDSAGIVFDVLQDPPTVGEHGLTTVLKVRLATRPAAPVTVALGVTDSSEIKVLSDETLVFTPDNWRVGQIVALMGVQDTITDGAILSFLTATVTASADAGYAALPVVKRAILCLDDDVTVTVSVSAPEVQEGSTAHFILTRTGPRDFIADTPVRYVLSGRAISGQDFTALSGKAVIAKGELTGLVPIEALQDPVLAEAPENVTLQLVADGFIAGNPDSGRIQIIETGFQVALPAEDEPSPGRTDPCMDSALARPVDCPAPEASIADRDGDGIADGADNCIDLSNRDQVDQDGDRVGDACDPDRDGDSVWDTTPYPEVPVDNCPDVHNPSQGDLDEDGIGDACDDHFDIEALQAKGNASAQQEAQDVAVLQERYMPSTLQGLGIMAVVGLLVASILVFLGVVFLRR